MSARRLHRVARLAAVVAASALPLVAQSTTRVSVSSNGAEGNYMVSSGPAISADGRYVAFSSAATTLVPGDVNNNADLFIHDVQTLQTTRITNDDHGSCSSPSLSSDGRFVAFTSDIPSLVFGDTNGMWDAFVHDRQTGVTSRVSVSTGGAQANANSRRSAISGDGRFVAFESEASNLVAGDTNGRQDIFVCDRQVATTTLASLGYGGALANGDSLGPTISGNGRFVAFESYATNLVPGDTNGVRDIFVRDLLGQATECASVNMSGLPPGQGQSLFPSTSDDGRWVAFASSAAGLVPGDTNDGQDVFVRDRLLGTTERVNLNPSGQQSGSQYWYASFPSISGNGRCVAFQSTAPDLLPPMDYLSHVYVRDRLSQLTERVSVSSNGTVATGGSGSPSISRDGRWVAFQSDASDLVPGDTNGLRDDFARDRGAAALCVPAVWVDCAYGGVETGTYDEPFDSVAEALLAACSGGAIVLKASVCSAAPVSITTPVTLKSTGGPSTIR